MDVATSKAPGAAAPCTLFIPLAPGYPLEGEELLTSAELPPLARVRSVMVKCIAGTPPDGGTDVAMLSTLSILKVIVSPFEANGRSAAIAKQLVRAILWRDFMMSFLGG